MNGADAAPAPLPDSMVFIERDWLSSNQVLLVDGDVATLIDSGYVKHAPMTLALIDAQKAIDMIKRLSIPLLGLVENMSYFVAPDTGKRYNIFGHGGAANAAAGFGMPFLGEVPLDMRIRETSDGGRPVVSSDPNGPQASAFRAIAREILRRNPGLR